MLHPGENYQDELKMLEDDANLSIEELRQKYCNEVVEEEYDDTQSTSTSDDTRKSEATDDAAANPDFTEPGSISLFGLLSFFSINFLNGWFRIGRHSFAFCWLTDTSYFLLLMCVHF